MKRPFICLIIILMTIKLMSCEVKNPLSKEDNPTSEQNKDAIITDLDFQKTYDALIRIHNRKWEDEEIFFVDTKVHIRGVMANDVNTSERYFYITTPDITFQVYFTEKQSDVVHKTLKKGEKYTIHIHIDGYDKLLGHYAGFGIYIACKLIL